MDENQNTQNAETKEEPRLFTQAEKDREIATLINRERDKFKGYEDIKKNYDSLIAEKKEREMSEKTEVEKLQSQLAEVNNQLVTARGEISEFSKEKIKITVLDNEKYRKLPRAYKNMVDASEDMETVQASAEKILEEYNQDMGGKISTTFGIPKKAENNITTPKAENTIVKSANDIATALREKIANATRR